MPNIIRTARTLVKVLPVLLVLGPTATTPALANQGAGDGRGERPATRYVTAKEMLRMNVSTLYAVTRQYPPAKLTGGMMGRYDIGYVADAIRSMRGPTSRLIERIENAQTLGKQKEIVNGLLSVHEAKYKSLVESLYEKNRKATGALSEEQRDLVEETRELFSGGVIPLHPDKNVQAYYDVAGEIHRLKDYIALLRHMKWVNASRRF